MKSKEDLNYDGLVLPLLKPTLRVYYHHGQEAFGDAGMHAYAGRHLPGFECCSAGSISSSSSTANFTFKIPNATTGLSGYVLN